MLEESMSAVPVLIEAMKQTLDEPDAGDTGPEYVSLHPRPRLTIEVPTQLRLSRTGDWIIPTTNFYFHLELPPAYR